jgi:hypothetical protein
MEIASVSGSCRTAGRTASMVAKIASVSLVFLNGLPFWTRLRREPMRLRRSRIARSLGKSFAW